MVEGNFPTPKTPEFYIEMDVLLFYGNESNVCGLQFSPNFVDELLAPFFEFHSTRNETIRL